jgi:phosphate transport system substrate-binding protein
MDMTRITAAQIMLCAGAIAVAAGTQAQPVDTRPMVEWIVPALTTNLPQTDEDAKEGQRSGRKLPPPEVLQPVLDSALPAFLPRKERLTGSFHGAASDVMKVIVEKWVEKFRTYHPEVTFTIPPPYAGSLGAVELVKGDLDFVFVSRELKPDDVKGFKDKFGYDPLSVPVSGGSYRHFGALDAIAFYVNKDNPIEKISFDQLDAMYSSTHHRGGKPISQWGDLGLTGEWADKPVKLYGIKPWNGFEEFVRQRVLSSGNKRGEWREDIAFEKVVFPVAKKVSADRYGIGYSGIAYIDAGVKVIPLVETAGGPPQAPTYDNVALATYPLSRLTYFNTNKAPGKPLNPALDEFLRFILSREGQQVVLDQASYIPLRGNQVQSSRALLSK